MIYCLIGKLLKKTPDMAVLCCGGVGYQVQIPAPVCGALPAVGQEATLYTYMNISENDIALFGFETEEQQACFKMLLGVSGVGPKAALAILSVMTPERVTLSISAEDFKAFTAASGVGPKLAKRITLELKDKVAKDIAVFDAADVAVAAPSGAVTQAVAALVSLGYSPSEAAQAVAKADETLPVEEIIKLALRSMAGKR